MVLAECAAWLAVLGWVDRATGYELGLFALMKELGGPQLLCPQCRNPYVPEPPRAKAEDGLAASNPELQARHT
jgi:hypothetical protein